MDKVKLGRVAGLFSRIPYDNYIQSPVGLVPKAGGKTRMIFHLSFNFSEEETGRSLNACTPRSLCTVKYNDLDAAVHDCLRLVQQYGGDFELMNSGTSDGDDDERSIIFLGKTDLSAAFRVLPLKIKCLKWLIFKAEDPGDGVMKFFVEKCLPFGASISCLHYQHFSNALKFLLSRQTAHLPGRGKAITNYLDDFLFIALFKWVCNQLIRSFLHLCAELRIPVTINKTEWAAPCMVFLGILLNGRNLTISVPLDKQEKALHLLNDLSGKKHATIKELQVLTGYLNFLTKTIVPGRTFTRRMYNKFADTGLKQFHHVKLDQEFRFDCELWRTFLTHSRNIAVCRPMVDFSYTRQALEICFFSDASANKELGVGAVYNTHWLFTKWEKAFIQECKPSIEYLQLYGMTAALLTWGRYLRNRRVTIFCNNTAVVDMVNNCASSCKNCMYLLRLIMLDNLTYNRRIFVSYIKSADNDLSDVLSHLQLQHFWKLAPPWMDSHPTHISADVWPVSKIWVKN